MPDLDEGQQVTVQGSGANQYVLSRDRNVYSCTCPAWRNMRLPITQRRCKHLIAYLEDISLDAATGRPRVAPAAAYVAPRPAPAPRRVPIARSKYEEQEPLRGERTAALDAAVDLHLVFADKMEEAYGLRLPREVAWAAGFYLALREDERAELATYATRGLIGIGAWFLDDAPPPRANDERLRDRKADDPPELIAVLSGGSEGERFAYVYDEPSELPSGVIRHEDGKTTLCGPTLLEALRDRVAIPPEGQEPTSKQALRRSAILSWLDEVIRRKERAEAAEAGATEESAVGLQSLTWARHGKSFLNPYVPGWRVPDDLVGTREHHDRHEAYEKDPETVERWVLRAKSELDEGFPGRALFLGREMWISGISVVRAYASELLIRAYALLGRNALLDVVRVHHLAFFPDVPLYELPPPHPIVLSASADDAAGLAQAWMHNAPNDADIEEALKRAASVEVFDAIFDRIDDEARDRACRTALGRRLTQLLKMPAASKERKVLADLIGRFIDRATIDARVFERVLEAKDNVLAEKAAKSVDLTSRSQGSTPLHIAAHAADPHLVKVLIERGADVRATNARGRMAFDDAMMASRNSANDAHRIMLMLEAAGGGVGKVPTQSWATDASASLWAVGDKVHHAKFGEGIVERVDGSGDEAKLTIAFTPAAADPPPPTKGKARAAKPKKELKVLMGKFVERR